MSQISQAATIELVYGNARYFKEIVKALNVFNDEVNIKVDVDGLSCQFMDPSHVMMLKLELPKEVFDTFLVEESKVICLNLTDLVKKAFKNVYKEDQVKIRIERDKATFTLFSDLSRNFKVNLLDVLDESYPEPKISLNANVKLVLKALDRILKDASNISDKITLTCNDDGLSFDAKEDYEGNEYRVTVDRYSDYMLNIENKDRDPQKAMYIMDYLNSFVKALKPLTDVMEISFSTDLPLKIKADLVNLGRLTFWLAPRVNYEETKEEIREDLNEEVDEDIEASEKVGEDPQDETQDIDPWVKREAFRNWYLDHPGETETPTLEELKPYL